MKLSHCYRWHLLEFADVTTCFLKKLHHRSFVTAPGCERSFIGAYSNIIVDLAPIIVGADKDCDNALDENNMIYLYLMSHEMYE